MRYAVRAMGEGDLPLLRGWRSRPHVVRWWGEAEEGAATDGSRDPRIATWIAEWRSRPFAFLQDYDVRDWSPHHFDALPAGSRGLDLYIGEAGMLGAGHGSRLLRQHAESLFGRGVPAVGIDPHPENEVAIHASRKAGFAVAGGPLETCWGRAILMVRYAPRGNGDALPRT